MATTCPTCKREFAADQVNVARDVAYCTPCRMAFSLSELAAGHSIESAVDLDDPPRGTWLHDDGVEVRIGATTRHAMALLLVPFTLVWAGGSLGGIYGSQLKSGQFDLKLSLFGIPFLIGSVFLVSFTLMMVFGRVEVRLRHSEGRVFAGVGPIGWTRRFTTDAVTDVREGPSMWGAKGGARATDIILDGPRRFRFGAMLSENRRLFVIAALRRAILRNKA